MKWGEIQVTWEYELSIGIANNHINRQTDKQTNHNKQLADLQSISEREAETCMHVVCLNEGGGGACHASMHTLGVVRRGMRNEK